MSDSIVADGTPLGKMRGAGDAADGAGFDAAASASRRFGAYETVLKFLLRVINKIFFFSFLAATL